MHKQRDIVLIPIPFTDLTSQKKRPAIIISSDAYNNTNEDIIVVAVTSNVEPRNFAIILNGDGFIITAYLTDKIKKGVTVYEAH